MNWQLFWQRKGIGNYALLPVSGVYAAVTKSIRGLYKLGIRRQQRAFCPVIVVGNITIGGAGKTPLVIALVNLLSAAGVRCAVISKGYGGSFSDHHTVERNDRASLVGDEPLLIKLSCECPVVVAKSRIDACRIIEHDFPETQVILTDDGLQHYQLYRDMEVCVVNSAIGLGNGWLLPAGSLREGTGRLSEVDFVVHNGDSAEPYHYVLADRGWRHIHRDERRYPDEFSCDRANNVMLSGIAHPQLFFQRVERMGVRAEPCPLPDHHAITSTDLPQDKTLLMTAKDWVKAKEYAHNDAWYLAVEAMLSGAFKADFVQSVKVLIRAHTHRV